MKTSNTICTNAVVRITLLFVLSTCFLTPSEAETLVLVQGGRIEGTILNPANLGAPDVYRVRTVQGVVVEISSKLVEYVTYPGTNTEQYDKKVLASDDTVEAHLALATWCEDNRLSSLGDRHYRRVIELDPDNETAHKGLGHIKRDGVWTTLKALNEAKGLVLYEGKWILPQEKRLAENRKKNIVSTASWSRQVNQWQADLGGRRNDKAVAGFQSIKDPAAVPALAKVLFSDKRDAARMLYIGILGRLGTPDAMKVLAQCAMNDPIEEVRLTCLDVLEESQAQAAVDFFVTELKSKDNIRVNRAAALIGKIGDLNAVPPLIQALETTHKYKISGGPGMSVGTGNDGQSGLAMGGKDKIIQRVHQNPEVLEALKKITQQNYFGYDRQAWTQWYTQNKQRSSNVDLRRN